MTTVIKKGEVRDSQGRVVGETIVEETTHPDGQKDVVVHVLPVVARVVAE